MATVFAVPEMQSPFDRRAVPAYVLIAAMALVGLFFCVALRFSISPAIFPQFFGVPLMSVLAGWGLRRIGRPNLGSAMEVLGLLFVQGLAAFFVIAPLATVSLPFADGWLSQTDRLLGFDWLAYSNVVQGPFFRYVYASFSWQPALVLLTVFLTDQSNRGWQILLAAVVALAISAALFPLAPAVGSSIHYGVSVLGADKPFAPALLSLRNGHRILDNSVFTGLISFPSYHAAAAVIFAWGCWTTRLRWPMLILNILMAASAITIGAHYLVDILAGLAVGALSIIIAERTSYAT